MTFTYTHKGWFGFVPVYLNMYDGEMCPIPRWHLPGWLIDVAGWWQDIQAQIGMWPDGMPPGFLFRCGNPLRRTFTRTIDFEG